MKKYILFTVSLLLSLAIISCDDTTTDPIADTGTVYIESTPTGAQIWLNGVNTGEVTPGTIEATAGSHEITLKKDGYADLTLTVNVSANQEFILTSGTTLAQMGSLVIESEPAGATIWLDGVNTNEVTPNNFSVPDDNYTVTLQLAEYSDTTFITQVANGGTTTETINLRPTFVTVHANTLWETIGTTSEQPSGLDLSTGTASSISTGVNQNVDVFYESNGFIVMSANGRNDMTRETYFKVGSGNDLWDGVNSPVKDNTWTTSVLDTETNYVYLYDADGHYSKFIIVDIKGGTPGDPARLEVKWLYNENGSNTAF